MQDVEFESLGLLAWYHIFFFALYIPLSAVRSRKKLIGSRVLPSKRRHFQSVIVIQLFFLAFSWFVASREWIEIFPARVPRWPDVAWGAVTLAVLVTFMLPRWKRAVELQKREAYLHMPRNGVERALWIGVSAVAGFGEEITYRGVLFALFTRLTHQPLLAAVLSALAFGAGHWVQGWKTAVTILAFAAVFQLLAHVSGALYVSMAVHFAYDVIAGLMYGHFGEKLGYPLEGPAETAPEPSA